VNISSGKGYRESFFTRNDVMTEMWDFGEIGKAIAPHNLLSGLLEKMIPAQSIYMD
jgi:hypothetical protein